MRSSSLGKCEHFDPLYTSQDVLRTLELLRGAHYNRTVELLPGIRATFVDAGHILDSASVIVDSTEGNRTKQLACSGDIGRTGLAIVRDPALRRERTL